MNRARIETRLSAAGISKAGVVFAGLWLRIDEGAAFPAEGWTDFIVVVLGWLASACVELMQRRTDRATVRFMEGPYLLELTRAVDGLRLVLVHAGLRRQIVADGTVASHSFLDSVLTAADATLQLVTERGWASADADALARATRILREEVDRLTS